MCIYIYTYIYIVNPGAAPRQCGQFPYEECCRLTPPPGQDLLSKGWNVPESGDSPEAQRLVREMLVEKLAVFQPLHCCRGSKVGVMGAVHQRRWLLRSSSLRVRSRLIMRGWGNTAEIGLLDISSSMRPDPTVFRACARKLKPVIVFSEQAKLDEASNRIPPTSQIAMARSQVMIALIIYELTIEVDFRVACTDVSAYFAYLGCVSLHMLLQYIVCVTICMCVYIYIYIYILHCIMIQCKTIVCACLTNT